MRNNGGGSLDEAVKLTGLFIGKGPVVQVRETSGKVVTYKSKRPTPLYSGPLGVLINNHSASASEIFAGAIKDYNRGLILGEPSYGKGTVQTVLDLNKFLPLDNKAGSLKLTIAMFYRVNGSSTQIKGVNPDIFIPNKESFVEQGEAKEMNALSWSSIKPTSYKPFDYISKNISSLTGIYNTRNKNTPLMKNLLNFNKWKKELVDDKTSSLNLVYRKTEKNLIKSRSLEFQNKFREIYKYPLLKKDSLDEDSEKSDTEKKYDIDAILDIATTTMIDLSNIMNFTKLKAG